MLHAKTKNVALTQNEWTRLLHYEGCRSVLEVQNLSAAEIVYVMFGENPWSLSFDGTDDYATVGAGAICDEEGNPIVDEVGSIVIGDGNSFLTAIADDDTGSIKTECLIDAVAGSSRVLFSVCDTGGDAYYLSLYINANGEVAAKCVVDSVTQWEINTSFPLDAGEYYIVKLVQNGSGPKIHVNGAESSIVTVTDTDLTAWINSISDEADAVYWGCQDSGSGAENFYAGDIHYIEYVQGVNGFGTFASRIARWRMDEGAGVYGEADEKADYTATFSATDGPTWADYEAGLKIGANVQYSFPEGERTTPESAVWAKTSAAGVNMRVLTGNNLKPANL